MELELELERRIQLLGFPEEALRLIEGTAKEADIHEKHPRKRTTRSDSGAFLLPDPSGYPAMVSGTVLWYNNPSRTTENRQPPPPGVQAFGFPWL
jgi:hypothetical protein